MEETKDKRKPKRVLKNIDFEKGTDTHLALVHRDQGGPASGADYKLVIKAANFSDEFLEKMQTVKVELEIPDFLERFFGLWGDNVDALAYLLGYREDMQEEVMESKDDFSKWVEDNMKSFEIVKALNNADNYAEVLSKLDEETYLQFLQDQQRFEKGLKKLEAEKQEKIAKQEAERKKPRVKKQVNKESPTVEKSAVVVTPSSSGDGGVDNPVVKLTKKESNMTDKVTLVEVVKDVEMIEKSQFEAIQKQLQDQQEQLQKALADVAKFEQEKKELIAKQRKQDILGAVKDEAKSEVLFKAVKDASDEDFQAVVKALGDLVQAVENSDLFVEKGVQVDSNPENDESPIAKALRNRLAKQQQ